MSGDPRAGDGDLPCPDHVLVTWLEGVVEALGAWGAVIVKLSEDQRAISPYCWVGYPREVVESWRRIPLSLPTPLTDAVRDARPVSVTAAQMPHRYREMTRRPLMVRAGYAVAPLVGPTGAVWGALGLSFAEDDAVLHASGRLPELTAALIPRLPTLSGAEGEASGKEVEPAPEDWSPIDWGLFEAAVDVLLAAAPVGFALLDANLRFLQVNEQLAEINGLSVASHIGKSVREVVPDLAEEAEPILRQVLATGAAVHDLELSGTVASSPEVDRHWLESIYRVVTPQGETGLAVAVWEVTGRVEAERGRAHTLALLDLLIMHAPMGIAFLDRDLRFVRINQSLAALNGLPVADHLGRTVVEVLPGVAPTVVPLLHGVLETGQPVVDLQLQTGPTAAHPARIGHWLVSVYAVPAVDSGGPEGLGLLVSDITEKVESERERARLDKEAADARRTADLAHRRLALLAQVGDVLSSSLDEEDVLRRFAEVLVPTSTDWLVVLVADGRGRLVPRYSVHADRDLHHLAQNVLSVGSVSSTGPTITAQVFRDQRPAVAHDITPHLREPGMPAELTRAALQLHPGPGLLLPMVVRGRSVGVLSLVHSAGRPDDLSGEVELFTQVARRLAIALDNARLFGQRSRIASRLQEDLLPSELPSIPGVQLAVRYSTAEEAVDVGGDLYDVVPRSEADSWLLVIGDVAGRGVDAAGVTGLARHTLAALADLPPAQALERLNHLMIDRGMTERFLTAAVAHLTLETRDHVSPVAARLRVARAGHPYPLLLQSDGTTRFLMSRGGLLGVVPDLDLEELEVALTPGDTLVFYTDGVTETPGSHGLFGDERLAHAARSAVDSERGAGMSDDHGGAPMAAVADQVADRILDALDDYRAAAADDDVALLVVHITDRPSEDCAPPRPFDGAEDRQGLH